MTYGSSTFGFEQVSLLGSSHRKQMKSQAADRAAENKTPSYQEFTTSNTGNSNSWIERAIKVSISSWAQRHPEITRGSQCGEQEFLTEVYDELLTAELWVSPLQAFISWASVRNGFHSTYPLSPYRGVGGRVVPLLTGNLVTFETNMFQFEVMGQGIPFPEATS